MCPQCLFLKVLFIFHVCPLWVFPLRVCVRFSLSSHMCALWVSVKVLFVLIYVTPPGICKAPFCLYLYIFFCEFERFLFIFMYPPGYLSMFYFLLYICVPVCTSERFFLPFTYFSSRVSVRVHFVVTLNFHWSIRENLFVFAYV